MSKRRGHIEERENGTFRAIVSAGTDPLTGNRRFLRETWPSEKLAEKALTRLLNQVDEQTHAATWPTHITSLLAQSAERSQI